MIRTIARFLRAFAAALEATAEPKPVEVAKPTKEDIAALALAAVLSSRRPMICDGAGPQQDLARQLVQEALLRDALERSIRKYSPRHIGVA